jgi:hypothetical protein
MNHLYFSDGLFEGFDLIPDGKTSKLIGDLKLITKKKGNTWNLFFQTDGPFATTQPLLTNKEFFFTLSINDSSFYSITGISYLHGKDEMLFFNSAINSVIVPEKRKVYALKFDYRIHHDIRPVKIIVSNSRGTELLNETIIDANIKSKEIDLSVNGENVYNISEDTVPPGHLENEKIYAKETIDTEPLYGTVYFKVLPIDADPVANQYKINIDANNK